MGTAHPTAQGKIQGAARPAMLFALALVVGLASGAGCYKPTIDDPGFACNKMGKACPDGFGCGPGNLCYALDSLSRLDSGVVDLAPDKNPTEAGPDTSSCTAALPAVPVLCADPPKAGDACNPACQTGCPCGRCNIVGKTPTCVAVGKAKLGDVCTFGAGDDCDEGLICLREKCGNGLARCYRHCTKNAQCGSTFCQVPINDASDVPTGYNVCDIAPRACNPVTESLDCGNPALKCYLTGGNETLCDCPNPKLAKPAQNHEPCGLYNDCDFGLVCVSNASMPDGPHCRFACTIATPSCGGGAACINTGTKFGFCDN